MDSRSFCQYSIRKGATTIWERWDGWTEERGFQDYRMNSFNHYSLGSVGEWLYRSVGGIEPLPSIEGHRQFRIHPYPSPALTWAKTEWRSVYGMISSYWRIKDEVLFLEITLPPNSWCTLTIPTSSPSVAMQALSVTRESKEIRAFAASIEIKLESGHYSFEVPYATDVLYPERRHLHDKP